METHYCFPLPLVTHRLLIRFWMIDPNGASLCVSDLLDGLCPLQLADELEQVISRLEDEGVILSERDIAAARAHLALRRGHRHSGD